jgi:hypothetical protein
MDERTSFPGNAGGQPGWLFSGGRDEKRPGWSPAFPGREEKRPGWSLAVPGGEKKPVRVRNDR